MSFLDKVRLPYRDDMVFSLLAFSLFVIPLIFSLFTYENFESVKASLFFILSGAAALVFLFKARSKRLELRVNRPLLGAWLLLMGFATLSAILAGDRLYSFFGFYYRYTSGWLFFSTLSLFLLLLWQTLDKQRLEFLLKILVFVGLVVALFVFFQGLGWIIYAGLEIGGFFRGPGLLGNTNYSGMFLAVLLPVAWYFFQSSKNFNGKIYYGFALFWFIFANLILASRGAMLAMLASLVLIFLLLLVFKFPRKSFLAILFFVLLGISFSQGLLSISRPDAISGLFKLADQNASSRFYAWEVSLEIIKKQPFLGSGLGNYALAFQQAQDPFVAPEIRIFDDAHNLFLHLAVSGGLPLAVCFFGAILIAALLGFKHLLAGKDLFSLTLLGSLFAWVVGVSFNPVPVPMYLLLAVLLAALSRQNLSLVNLKLGGPGKAALAIIPVLILLFGSVTFFSEHLLGLSRDFYGQQKYKTAYSLASLSWAINPTNEISIIYKTASGIFLGRPREELSEGVQRVKSLHPLMASSYSSASSLFALSYFKNKNSDDLEKAISTLEHALRVDPYFSDRYGQLALYYFEQGDLAKAETAVRKALEFDRKSLHAWIFLSKLEQLKGNKAGTIFALKRAFSINPLIPQLKFLLQLAETSADIRQVPIEIIVRKPNL